MADREPRNNQSFANYSNASLCIPERHKPHITQAIGCQLNVILINRHLFSDLLVSSMGSDAALQRDIT